jgi:DNA-binding MltR family transcriptional regulator
MASSSLKSLLKTPPTLEDELKAMAELSTDGPRGAIILGSALVEDLLRSVIHYHMRSLKVEEFNQLFTGTAPLTSFSARTKVAYAFNLIGPKTRDDLDKLRELRNAFAHSQIILTFDTPEVISQLNSFNCISTIDDI